MRQLRDREFDAIAELAGELLTKKATPKAALANGPTFQSIGDDWTLGKLNERFPDHVKLKRSADRDTDRLEKLYETIGGVPIVSPRGRGTRHGRATEGPSERDEAPIRAADQQGLAARRLPDQSNRAQPAAYGVPPEGHKLEGAQLLVPVRGRAAARRRP